MGFALAAIILIGSFVIAAVMSDNPETDK